MKPKFDPLFDLAGRTIVVTGGLGILGRQFVKALLQRQARVALFDLPGGAARLGACFGDQAGHENLLYVGVDITDRRSLEAALQAVRTRWVTPHGLVNSAALDSPPDAPADENGPFESYPEDSWDRVMEVNVKGTMLCCQVIGGAMAEAGRGSVVLVSSTYGMVSPNQSIYEYRRGGGEAFYKPVSYAVSKSALFNLTRYLATYWAAAGVRVNTLTFGGVFNGQDPQFLAGYEQHVPVGRMARADEYNGAVVFLLAAASSYMTGSNLVLDGGWTAW